MTGVVVQFPAWGTLRANGPDAREWLNGLVTCDVGSLQPGRGAYGLLLTKRGKIVADLAIAADDAGLWLGSSHPDISRLAGLLDHFLVMEDVELTDESSQFAWIRMLGAGALAVANRHSSRGVAAMDWGPHEGAVIVAPRDSLVDARQRLEGDATIAVLDGRTWDAWRVANGVPVFGTDFGEDDNPHEAGIEQSAVSFTKGCYLGQEVVCMQDMRGKVKRRLVRLVLPDSANPSAGDEVADQESQPVGVVTSAASAPLGDRFAIAKLRAPHFEPGTMVTVGGSLGTVAELLPPSD